MPLSAHTTVSCVFEDFFERAVFRSGREKKLDSFVHGFAGGFRSRAGAGNVEWHGMGNKLVSFLPDLDRILEFHAGSLIQRCAPGNAA